MPSMCSGPLGLDPRSAMLSGRLFSRPVGLHREGGRCGKMEDQIEKESAFAFLSSLSQAKTIYKGIARIFVSLS